ncbi:hypothetical protein GE21DRAFT_5946 [Neurospora crassa]|uniref:Uncharacterized protein n=1 Tax=Neurospora crassa (strain ATCC 24698 / 74-OR23-1A / CBS 708.71 / DSM 1257 / FGSC 987) TaxID=367110 RepID=Q7SAB8_NEUCR|nr:hypothetical protein NCU06313 [Neurospora crassa OR74A]EAA33339.1 hypothetical protein NCU06313 [Neurospora crassa OR74A]KHE83198.1 hypothetical protein GE21DRAFT_5946 [Neurospora crassa]|eukprot:XP_962575.1 hypothetical protein NCU06313 [Neurospora crassa OR74A]
MFQALPTAAHCRRGTPDPAHKIRDHLDSTWESSTVAEGSLSVKSSPLSETVEISYPPPLSPSVGRPKTEQDARCLTATCLRRQPLQSRYLTISTSSPLRDIFRSLQEARNTGHLKSMVNDAEIGGRVKGFEHLAIVPRLCQDSATVTDLVRVRSPGPQDKTTVLGLGVADR